MKKLILALIIIASMSSICYAFNPLDKLQIPSDKQLHILVSERIADTMHDELGLNYLQSGAAMIGISLIKEYWDEQAGGKWDNTDIYANMAGWGVNIALQQLEIELNW